MESHCLPVAVGLRERPTHGAASVPDHLIACLVAAAQALLEDADFERALRKWLGHLAQAVGASRAMVGSTRAWSEAQMQRADGTALQPGIVELPFAHWESPGAPKWKGPELDIVPDRVRMRERLLAGHDVWMSLEALIDASGRSAWRHNRCACLLAVPVHQQGRVVGWICFDWAEPRAPDEMARSVLGMAAVGASSALQRHQGMVDALAERDRRLAAEQARAEESERLAGLLHTLVSSSRALIDAAQLQPWLCLWLRQFGLAVRAQSAALCLLRSATGLAPRGLAVVCEWPGDAGSAPLAARPPGLAEGVADALDVARVTVTHEGPLTQVCVPLVRERELWGCLLFCHDGHRDVNPGEAAVLLAAASTLGTILQRQDAVASALAEREARIALQQQRFGELASANRALRASLDALAEGNGESGFRRQSLLEIAAQAGAQRVYLFKSHAAEGALMHAAEGTLMLQGSVAGGRFSDAGWPDDPSAFQRPFDMAPALRLKLMAHDRLQWHPVGASAQAEDLVPEMTPWCRAAHFRAQALHALMAGERLVGVVFMMFADDTPLSAQQQEVTQALCQPLTLALELTRLAQQVQRAGENAAVLSERNRLAREIHDGIAQSFLAIQMQLDLLKQAGAVSRPVALARELAGHGLTEARRAVAALRPHGLVGRDLPDALESLAHQLMAGATLRLSMERPPAWEPLPMRVEDHLYRMVQEALNNVVKHAGARHVRIELSQSLAEINVLIADDGVGFDPKQASAGSGFGLEGLEQRAQAIGARMHWLTRPGHGCQVLITLRREGLAPDGERAS